MTNDIMKTSILDQISDWDWAMEAAALAAGVWFKDHPADAEMFAIAMRAQKGDAHRDLIINTFKAEAEFIVYDPTDTEGMIERLGGAGPTELAERQKRFHKLFTMLVMAIRASGGEIRIGPAAAVDGFPDNLMIVETKHPMTDSIILTLGEREEEDVPVNIQSAENFDRKEPGL